MDPHPTLLAFDRFLAVRTLKLEAVVVGGVALRLLGVISRPTLDCDILHPPLPAPIEEAARAFALERRADGEDLPDNWLNNDPEEFREVLPAGWLERSEPLFDGAALSLRVPHRLDLLRTKLAGLCVRGTDLADCLAMAPSPGELAEVKGWAQRQRVPRPDWAGHVGRVLDDLARRLGHPAPG